MFRRSQSRAPSFLSGMLEMEREFEIKNRWLIEIGKTVCEGDMDKARDMAGIAESVVRFVQSCAEHAATLANPLAFFRDEEASPAALSEPAVISPPQEEAEVAAPVVAVNERNATPGNVEEQCRNTNPHSSSSFVRKRSVERKENVEPNGRETTPRRSPPVAERVWPPPLWPEDRNSKRRSWEPSPSTSRPHAFMNLNKPNVKGNLLLFQTLSSNVIFGDGTHFALKSLKNLSVVTVPLDSAKNEFSMYCSSHYAGNLAKVQKAALFYGDKLLSMGRTPEQVHGQILNFLAFLRTKIPNAQIFVFTIPPAPRIAKKAEKLNELIEKTVVPGNMSGCISIDLAGMIGDSQQEWTPNGAEMSPKMAHRVLLEVLQLCQMGKQRERQKRQIEAQSGPNEPLTKKSREYNRN